MISAPPAPFQRPGANVATGSSVGTTVFVTSVANVNGLIIRTFYLTSVAGADNFLRAGGKRLFGASSGNGFNYTGPGVLVPPGQAVDLIIAVSSATCEITWDFI